MLDEHGEVLQLRLDPFELALGKHSCIRFLLQSLAIASAASALFIYISAAPAFVLQILRLPETSFAWLFVPMITGIMIGSLAAGRMAHFWRPERTIRIGFFIMTGAAIVNVLYAAFLTVAIPALTRDSYNSPLATVINPPL